MAYNTATVAFTVALTLELSLPSLGLQVQCVELLSRQRVGREHLELQLLDESPPTVQDIEDNVNGCNAAWPGMATPPLHEDCWE